MSLKAKLEAVIYAAEEPVTLAQLASLFAVDAYEWKAEKAAAAAAGLSEPAGDSFPLLVEDIDNEDVTGMAEVEAASTEGEVEEFAAGKQPESEEATEEEVVAGKDAEAEAKRQARQRDREVRGILREILDEITASYAEDGRGIEIREIAGGYRMATKPECHDAVRLFIKSLKPPMKLSLPALETLAVIAYKQPVTAPEVNEIRGVESAGVLGSLLSRKLITTAGRKQVIGRPILYKTTKEFLLRFGLKDVSELPSMEEFEKIAAVELAEASEETESGFEHVHSTEPELDPDSPEPEDGDEPSQPPSKTAPTAAQETAAAEPEMEAEALSHD